MSRPTAGPSSAEPTPEQWGLRQPQCNQLIVRPPAAARPMTSERQLGPATPLVGDNATSLETFPMRRHNHPHYQRLTTGYYRLHQKNGEPLHSRERIHADDPSLAEFAFEHLSPPGSVSSLRHYVCRREAIHPSRVRIYIPHAHSSDQPDLDRAAKWRDPLPTNRGNDENWAFKVEVKMHDDEDLHDLRHAAGVGDRVELGCEECCEGWDAGCRSCGHGCVRRCGSAYVACAEGVDVCLSSCVLWMRERCCSCSSSHPAWDGFEHPRHPNNVGSCCADIGAFVAAILYFPLWAIACAVRWFTHYVLLCQWVFACHDFGSFTYRDEAKEECIDVCHVENPFYCLPV